MKLVRCHQQQNSLHHKIANNNPILGLIRMDNIFRKIIMYGSIFVQKESSYHAAVMYS